MIELVQELALPKPSAHYRELILSWKSNVQATDPFCHLHRISLIPKFRQSILNKPRQIRRTFFYLIETPFHNTP